MNQTTTKSFIIFVTKIIFFMKKLTLVLTLLYLVFYSCSQPSQGIEEQVATKLTEKHQEFHPNGTLKIKGDIVNNLKQGKWESFYENGVKWSESTYLFGKRNGIYKSFYPNGRLKIHGMYENDEKFGNWFFYNENGEFEKEIDFGTSSTKKDANESN